MKEVAQVEQSEAAEPLQVAQEAWQARQVSVERYELVGHEEKQLPLKRKVKVEYVLLKQDVHIPDEH